MSKLFNNAVKTFNGDASASLDEPTVRDLVAKIKEDSATVEDSSPLSLSGVRRTSFPMSSELLISAQQSHTELMEECYRSLRTRLMRLQAASGRRSIVITSATEGDGKTLTTANLGLCYAQLPKSQILMIDADLRSRGLSTLIGETQNVGLAEVLGGGNNRRRCATGNKHS